MMKMRVRLEPAISYKVQTVFEGVPMSPAWCLYALFNDTALHQTDIFKKVRCIFHMKNNTTMVERIVTQSPLTSMTAFKTLVLCLY